VTHAEVEDYAQSLALSGSLRGSLEYYRTFEADAAANRGFAAEKLRIPVLGIGGDRRWGPAMQGIVDRIAERGRGASLADCGHWLVEERPAELTKALVEFLES